MICLTESFDEIFPISRDKPSAVYVLDEWSFEVNGKVHVVRFNYSPKLGKRASSINFGIKRGKKVSRKIKSVPNIRKYLATVIRVVEEALAEPTRKLKQRRDGVALVIPDDVFERMGPRLMRIIQRRFRQKFNILHGFHEYDKDNLSAVYLWRKGKQFKTVFGNLTHVDDLQNQFDDENFADSSASHAYNTNDDMVSKKIISTVDDEEDDNITDIGDEIIPDEELSGVNEPTILSEPEKRQKVRELGGKSVQERLSKVDNFEEKLENDAFETYVAGELFKNSFKAHTDEFVFAKKTSSLAYHLDPIVDQNKVTNCHYFVSKRNFKFPNLKIIMIALNIRKVRTDNTYDDLSNEYSSIPREFTDVFGFKFPKEIIPTEFISLPWSDIIDIARNAESIVKESIDIDMESELFLKKFPVIDEKRIIQTPNTHIDDRQLVLDLLASSEIFDKPREDLFKYVPSSDGNKLIKEISKRSPEFGNVLLSKVRDYHISGAESVEDYIEFNSALPNYLQDPFISEDDEIFEAGWTFSWTLTGNSHGAYVAYEGTRDLGVNQQLGSYYVPFINTLNGERFKDAPGHQAILEKRNIIQNNFEAIYKRTQEYYLDKLGEKKYNTKKVKLYRGLAVEDLDAYSPGPLESWSSQVSTAKKFSRMMSHSDDKKSVIFMTEVYYKDIFASYETMPSFPGEEDLQGKREHILFGGIFATTPLYLYDVHGKDIIDRITVKEWFNMNEEIDKEKRMKIITPSDKGFEQMLKNGNIALGNDEEEFKYKTLTPKGKKHREKQEKENDKN